MTEIEVAEIVIKQNGYCGDIDCSDCPAERIRIEKGFDRCVDLWYDHDYDKQKQWFENWLKEDGDKGFEYTFNENIMLMLNELDQRVKILEAKQNEEKTK